MCAIDDDGDGLADCADPACGTLSACGAVVPGDPFAAAPSLASAAAPSFASSIAFLHEGSSPVQVGVEPGAIDARRASALFGRVRDVEGAALPGARVTILGHPELGSTHTRAAGRYDLVVDGGGPTTVQVELGGHITSQRTLEPGWNRWEPVGDIVLVPYDPRVTQIELGATGLQVARGSTASDMRGERTATITAEMELPTGTSQLDALHVRATELTVGELGPERMPGSLPATTGYTYAVELSVDEAVSAGARSVRFNQPAIFYLENYWGFSVGQAVPAGYYARDEGRWIPDESGRVIEVVAELAGLADLDIDGDGVADDPGTLGITTDELVMLATLYEQVRILRLELPGRAALDPLHHIRCC